MPDQLVIGRVVSLDPASGQTKIVTYPAARRSLGDEVLHTAKEYVAARESGNREAEGIAWHKLRDAVRAFG